MFHILTSLLAFTGKFLPAGNLYRTMMSPWVELRVTRTPSTRYSSRMTLQYEKFFVREVTPVLGPGGFGCTGIIIDMFIVPTYIDIYRPPLFNQIFNHNISELFLSM